MSEIYEPEEDSRFFQGFLKEYLESLEGDIEFLDMGTGSGILAKTASEIIGKEKVTAVDINPDAVDKVASIEINSIQSNLFSNISGKFDIITFNAPYLPEDEREPKESALATTGGKKGDEISLEFLKQAKEHLNPGGKIFLLISSLTPLDKIKEFNPVEVARKKIDFEDLIILKFE